MTASRPTKLSTRIVRAGRSSDAASGAIVSPIVLSTSFAHESNGGFVYGRSGNPNRSMLETALADLEGARHAFAFASGLAAITALFQTLRRDDEVLCDRRTYPGTLRILWGVLGPLGVEMRITDVACEGWEQALTDRTRIVWVESPTNPGLELIDIQRVASVLDGRSVYLAVDNTVATPLYQRPLELGADVVCHSSSKFLGGHGDVLGGCVATSDVELAEAVGFVQNATGAVPSPFDCYLLLRGLATLEVRMTRISETASKVAAFLRDDPRVASVAYPDMPRGGSGLVTFVVRPTGGASGLACAEGFLRQLRLFDAAHSFGSVTSSAEVPAIMSHGGIPPEMLAAMGLDEGTVRLSIGLEDFDDLRDDLDAALTVKTNEPHLESARP